MSKDYNKKVCDKKIQTGEHFKDKIVTIQSR